MTLPTATMFSEMSDERILVPRFTDVTPSGAKDSVPCVWTIRTSGVTLIFPDET